MTIANPTRQLTTLQGWRRFSTDKPTIPALLSHPDWTRLDDHDRPLYDEARLDYHTRLSVVATSTVKQVMHAGRRAVTRGHPGHPLQPRRAGRAARPSRQAQTAVMSRFGRAVTRSLPTVAAEL